MRNNKEIQPHLNFPSFPTSQTDHRNAIGGAILGIFPQLNFSAVNASKSTFDS